MDSPNEHTTLIGTLPCPPTAIYQIEQNETVIFSLKAGSLISNRAVLLLNLPLIDHEKEKISYIQAHPRKVTPEPAAPSEDSLAIVSPRESPLGNKEFVVKFDYPGSFFFQLQYLNAKNELAYTEAEHIVVHPKFHGGDFSAGSLVIQSVYPRCLGKLSNWLEVLRPQANLRYNAIHFVPIQAYGSSGSMYSLKDQHSVDDIFFEKPEEVPPEDRLKAVRTVIGNIQRELNLLCFMDIVLNHTAVNSDWLLEHPEAAYNLRNSPHLTVAYTLDAMIQELSLQYASKKVPECPSAPYISSAADVAAIMKVVEARVRKLKLEEFFYADMDKIKNKLGEFLQNMLGSRQQFQRLETEKIEFNELVLKSELGHGERRFGVDINMESVGPALLAKFKKEGSLTEFWGKLQGFLGKANDYWRGKMEEWIKDILKNIEGGIRYEKLEMKNTKITEKNLIVRKYFHCVKKTEQFQPEFIAIHNGWCDKSIEFAERNTYFYLTRSIVVWDDSIKLFYGDSPQSNPYLWSHMESYVRETARVFDGIRIDNCHSTPIHVLEYMINSARSEKPNIFLFAELFTNNGKTDAMYTKKAGINALIRESMYVRSAEDLSGIMNMFGGCTEHPIGKIEPTFKTSCGDGKERSWLVPALPRALLYDFTHDNPTSIQVWNSQGILPATFAMARTPIGSTRGVDEFVPTNLSVIDEKRIYLKPSIDIIQKSISLVQDNSLSSSGNDSEEQKEKVQLVETPPITIEFHYKDAKSITVVGSFNNWSMSANPMSESASNSGIWTVSLGHLAPGNYEYKFVVNGKDWITGPGKTAKTPEGHINNLLEVPSAASTLVPASTSAALPAIQHADTLRPIRAILSDLHFAMNKKKSFIKTIHDNDMCITTKLVKDNDIDIGTVYTMITRTNFSNNENPVSDQLTPKRVVKLYGKLHSVLLIAELNHINPKLLKGFSPNSKEINGVPCSLHYRSGSQLPISVLNQYCRVVAESEGDSLEFYKMPSSFILLVSQKPSDKQAHIMEMLLKSLPKPILDDLSLGALNHLLYRCDEEEQEITQKKRGIYMLQNLTTCYAGIASLYHEFNRIKQDPSNSQSLLHNIKEGNWLIDYHLARIKEVPELAPLAEYMYKYLAPIKALHPYDKPKFFELVINTTYISLLEGLLRLSHPVFSLAEDFPKDLLLSTLQFMGNLPSSQYRNYITTMAAGLPHFSKGFMRCWGRDTMIALKGLLLIPGRFREARAILLMFASVMRHGLIPNLHDQGKNTRFNSRDATWWFMQAVQEYIIMDTENGVSILTESVDMQFLSNDMKEHAKKVERKEKKVMSFSDIIQTMMQSHASGISFTEWNAGPSCDSMNKGIVLVFKLRTTLLIN